MRIAAQVRLRKESHPEEFCTDRKCLWQILTRQGPKPCPKHMKPAPIVDDCDDACPDDPQGQHFPGCGCV